MEDARVGIESPTKSEPASEPSENAPLPSLEPPLKHLDTVVALYDFPGTQPLHLPLNLGDTIYVLVKDPSGWWDGVVSTQDGDILRGWFPGPYVRLVNYVQPVLNQLQGREVDLITAANTAANVLIPLFASLLQGKLNTGERLGSNLRKNSVVLFSDDHEDPKKDKSDRSDKPQPKTTGSRVYDLEPVLRTPLLNPLLSPLGSQESVPYKGDANVDSSDPYDHLASISTYLPLTHTLLLATAVGGSISTLLGAPTHSSMEANVLEISVVEQLAETYRQTHNSTLTWVAKVATNGLYVFYNEQLNVYAQQIPMSTYAPAPGDKSLRMVLPLQQTLEDMLVVDLGFGYDEVGALQLLVSVDATESMDSKRPSNALSMSSTNSGNLYHHFSQPLYAIDNLFYRNALDLKSWNDLQNHVSFLLELLLKSLQVSNKQLFLSYILELNNYVQFIFLACNLAQHDFSKTKYNHNIRKRLNLLASAYLRIHTNGLLHLSMMHYLHPLAGNILRMSLDKLNKSTSQPLSLQLSLATAHRNLGTHSPLSTDHPNQKNSARNSSELPLLQNNDKSNADKSNVAEKVSELLTSDITYLDQLEFDILKLRYCLQRLVANFVKITKNKVVKRKDYDGSDTSEDEGVVRLGILPQMYSRFISGEFNGGNWCNPFFVQNNPILNASGNELKNGRHSKIILDHDALNQAKGLSDNIKNISVDVLEYLNPEVQHKYFNESLRNDRNIQILRLVYKLLYYSLQFIDTIEAFDFTVFCLIKKSSVDSSSLKSDELGKDEVREEVKEEDDDREDKEVPKVKETSLGNSDNLDHENDNNDEENQDGEQDSALQHSDKNQKSHLNFDYPVVLEFFEYKQELHDYIANLLMRTQALTLDDQEVFKSMKEDDVLYNRDVMKDPFEKTSKLVVNMLCSSSLPGPGDPISQNLDALLRETLLEGMSKIDAVLGLIQQLIDEREMIINYATRVMHDDWNVQLLVIERNNTVALQVEREEHYYSGNKKRSDTPWYLEGDDEYDLLMDIKGSIKGGLREALVAHLTHHEVYDSVFDNSFLLTFSTIMSLTEFLQLLIQRFNIEAPEGLNYDEYNAWIAKKQAPIRKRVLTVMRLLLEKFWTPLFNKKPVLEKWLRFIELLLVVNLEIASDIREDLTKVLGGEVVCEPRTPTFLNTRTPAPLINKSFVKKLKLLDIDYVELARQLTLKEFSLFLKISMHSCIAKVWGRKLGLQDSFDSITKFIRTLNQLTNWVAYMILRKQEVKKRVQLIRYFVQVAEKCRQLNNYSLMTAIILALYSSPIHRLKKTWKMVTADTFTRLKNMNKLMNSLRNFNEYRDVLKFIGQEPCVPFFGVVLSDLTFVLHGNLDHLMNRPWMINFLKRSKTSEIVLAMDEFRRTGYNLLAVKEIQTYLDNWFDKCPTIDQLYQISLALEPREAALPKTGRSQRPLSKT